ncbi:glycosyltransferase family 4 protein [Candidatus Uhrbacteria bacterium]|nr:glycosyltransferase family 4 protein [Candidatus Uhrbacteria bacterium]
MRLLLPTPDYAPNKGGVAAYLGALAQTLSTYVTVVTTGLFSRYSFPRWFPIAWQLFRRRASYDMVLTSHVLPIGTAAMIVSFISKKPYAVIVHGMDVGILSGHKRWLARLVLARALFVVTNSQSLAQEVKRDWGRGDAIVCYPPVDDAILAASQEARVPSATSSHIQLLTVARLVPRKNHLAVLKTIYRLRKEGIDLRYRIVGDGSSKDSILDMIRSLGLDQAIELVTDADQQAVIDSYRTADLFVMPTTSQAGDREGFGLVYLEAGAFGIPSIGRRFPGVDEAILDGETGILVDSDEELDDAVRRMATNRLVRETLGKAAQERSMGFTRERCFEELLKRIK